MAQFSVNRAALRSLQELQVPGEVGRPLRRRRQQGLGAQAHAPRSSSTARAATPRPAASRRAAPSIEAITLERGVTHDPEFEKWANKVWNFGSGLGAEVSLAGLPQGPHHRGLQRGRPAGDRLQGVPLLGVGIPGAARPRRQRQRGGDPDAEARERGLGTRPRRDRADRAELHRAGVTRPCMRSPAHADRETTHPRRFGSGRVGRSTAGGATTRCSARARRRRGARRAQPRAAGDPQRACSAAPGRCGAIARPAARSASSRSTASLSPRRCGRQPTPRGQRRLDWHGRSIAVARSDRGRSARHRRP